MHREIRARVAADGPALARIYRQAIQGLGPSRYTSAQVSAWAGFAADPEAFAAWLDGATTLVAVDADDRPLGFAGLEPGGRVASLFVVPAAARRGIGQALLRRLLAEAGGRGLRQLTAEASAFSRPLFERFGFELVGVERVALRGVAFERYAMRRVD